MFPEICTLYFSLAAGEEVDLVTMILVTLVVLETAAVDLVILMALEATMVLEEEQQMKKVGINVFLFPNDETLCVHVIRKMEFGDNQKIWICKSCG